MGTHRYIYTYIERRIRFDVKGQGTHRAARSIARESGGRRRPTFLSGHRSSRVPRILTYFPSLLPTVLSLRFLYSLSTTSASTFLETSDTVTRAEREREIYIRGDRIEGELSMLMTCFKGGCRFLGRDIVTWGEYRGNLAKQIGIEIFYYSC